MGELFIEYKTLSLKQVANIWSYYVSARVLMIIHHLSTVNFWAPVLHVQQIRLNFLGGLAAITFVV